MTPHSPHHSTPDKTAVSPTALLVAYTVFVVYGSLVPLSFHPLPLFEAWLRFQNLPFLQLGVHSRADWIANGVLYAPVGFLATQAFRKGGLGPAPAATAAVVGALCLAVAIEFAQLFFPARTVSLNDLLAEGIGSVLGVAGALVWFRRDRMTGALQAGYGSEHHRWLSLYGAAYLAYSLFPYDLLLSGAELSQKLSSDRWSWWLAASGDRPLVTIARLCAEVLMSAPLGAWLAARRRSDPSPFPVAFAVGLAFGLAIEFAQLFIASGVTQGGSVIARAVGVTAGARLWTHRTWTGVRSVVLRSIPWTLPLYLLALVALNGWFEGAWAGASHITETLRTLNWLPFHYYYYTSEANALVSLSAIALAYAPAGLLGWARRSSIVTVALAALALSAAVEAGKLFVPGLRPDPTNLLIATAAASFVVWAARRAELRGSSSAPRSIRSSTERNVNAYRERVISSRITSERRDEAPSATPASGKSNAVVGQGHSKWGSPGLWLLAAAAVAWQLLSAPPLMLVTTLAVITAALTIAWRPTTAPVIFAAALPLFDFAPWTGRMLWDEFDLLLALGLAVAWARTPSPVRAQPLLWRICIALLFSSLVLSATIGFWPGAAFDVNSLASYHSPFNALRILKGAFWAYLLVGLWRRFDHAGMEPGALFARGVLIGLAGVVTFVLWERLLFAGLGDFSSTYRVTGPFSAMHRGGAFIECYIAVAMPLAAQASLSATRSLEKAAAAALAVAGSFAMMLTFSRNGYAALAIGMLVWTVLSLRARKEDRGVRSIAAVAMLVTAFIAALPVAIGGYARERFAQWERDLDIRVAHWDNALALRKGSLRETIFGTGLGSFPSLHYWNNLGTQHAARLLIARVDANPGEPASFLRLGSGSPTYLDQIVRLQGAERAQLKLKLRSAQPEQRLVVSLCEKWMLTSAKCVSRTVISGPDPAHWTTAESSVDLLPLVQASRWRPVKFSLHAPTSGATVDVAELLLTAPDGRPLVANGDFARGFDAWWMSTDVDPPYHVHSFPVAVLLEQGWLGVIAWGTLMFIALASGAMSAWRRSGEATGAVASLMAFGISALLNTLIDDPRFMLLALMLAWACFSPLSARGSGTTVQRTGKAHPHGLTRSHLLRFFPRNRHRQRATSLY